ncbi:hypothetical protein [Mycolicibacter kumamotonensis]|uniref:hypothetical protein n=1 Tax=Mycolicibacter kumamotonensis TaxID=354243 RepID=UPI00080661DB|nr:hypothetical protein [Mycolicibacter kumamotonensis]
MQFTAYKNRAYTGGRVSVHRNLHRDAWSVRACDGPHKGKTIGYASSIALRDAEFVVQPGGQERARKTRTRNVHAFITGMPLPVVLGDWAEFGWAQRITYNPFRHDHFVEAVTGHSVRYAAHVNCQADMACYATQINFVCDREAA